MDVGPVTFLGRSLGPSFRARVVTVAPGARRPYDESEWRDALVVVDSGEVALECQGGSRRTFGSGDIIWLTGMGVLALHNVGAESVVLVAVSRRPPAAPLS
jgi:quercetin dioxygenase-like cupin family protein